jgi:D-alanine-D-alanine ligase
MSRKVSKVAVLMGGPSSEREISLISGKAVSDALRTRGFDVTEVDLDHSSYSFLNETRPEVVFIALHGKPGEDGTVQGMLELLDLPYTGSGVLGSALAMDKAKSRELLIGHGIRVPRGTVLNHIDELPRALNDLKEQGVEIPLIIKPTQAGSSVGLTRVTAEEQIHPAVATALEFSPQALIEECLPGPEIKYTPGMSHHIIPPNVDSRRVREAEEMAFRAYRLMGISGCGRGEIMFDAEMNPNFLEFNTIPGMTEVSLLPDAARAAGIEFGELCERLIEYSLDR